MTLNEISVLSLYSAMAVYALAFIAFAIDLAKRSSAVTEAEAEAAEAGRASAVASESSAGSTQTLTKLSARIANDASMPYGRSPSLRVGVSLTVIAFILHVLATVLRGRCRAVNRGVTMPYRLLVGRVPS